MHYIGNKRRLLSFIDNAINEFNIDGDTFFDVFSGTGTVGNYFKGRYQIIANDLLYSSYVQQYVNIKLNVMPNFEKLAAYLQLTKPGESSYAESIIDYLNKVDGIEDFIYNNFAPGGTRHNDIVRKYFTDENAAKIDAIRELIEAWKALGLLSDDEFYVLLFALIDEACDRGNTTGMQSSFLKQFDPAALKPLRLKLPGITPSEFEHQIYCGNSVDLLDKFNHIDILYLDPPYTPIQYATAYHLLETIARWDKPTLYGISGKRNTDAIKSDFSSKRYAYAALEKIVKQGNYHHLLMSYNDESIIPHEKIMTLFKHYGEVTFLTKPLQRYKSVSSAHLPEDKQPRKTVEERLYYLKVDCPVFLPAKPTLTLPLSDTQA